MTFFCPVLNGEPFLPVVAADSEDLARAFLQRLLSGLGDQFYYVPEADAWWVAGAQVAPCAIEVLGLEERQ